MVTSQLNKILALITFLFKTSITQFLLGCTYEQLLPAHCKDVQLFICAGLSDHRAPIVTPCYATLCSSGLGHPPTFQVHVIPILKICWFLQAFRDFLKRHPDNIKEHILNWEYLKNLSLTHTIEGVTIIVLRDRRSCLYQLINLVRGVRASNFSLSLSLFDHT